MLLTPQCLNVDGMVDTENIEATVYSMKNSGASSLTQLRRCFADMSFAADVCVHVMIECDE